MKHPSKEELISLLYNEVSIKEKNSLTGHLQGCAECREQLDRWQHTKGDLNTWKVAEMPQSSLAFAPAIKWAIAAAFLLLVGFGIGRSAAPRINAEQLRAEIESALQESIHQRLAAARNEDRKQFIAMLRDVEEQRISDYTELRKDLETVAIVADRKLETTEQALNQLQLVAQSEATELIR